MKTILIYFVLGFVISKLPAYKMIFIKNLEDMSEGYLYLIDCINNNLNANYEKEHRLLDQNGKETGYVDHF